ncbi:hypothetical protein VN23_02170 [Janthinobacterium sp. B9-8]|nr:hypothetical protein VN23_02170 [Janthinobacterium sp. B9-8]
MYLIGFLMTLPSISMAATPCSRPFIVAASPLSIFMEVDDADRVTGVVPDFLAEITKATGCQFIYEVMPRIRALRMFESGKIDLIAASRTATRDAIADYINVISEQPSLIVLKERPNGGEPLDDLMQGKLTVNVVRGFDTGPEYRELLAKLRQKNQLEDVLDTDVIARKMLEKRCDATIVGTATFAKSIEKFNLASKLQAIPMESLPLTYSGFYFSKTSIKEKDRLLLMAEFNSSLKAGKLKDIFMKRVKNMSEFYHSISFEKP